MIGITVSPSGAPAARASPPVTEAMRQRTRKGPRTADAASPSRDRRPNPTRAHPLGVPRLSTWRGSGRAPGGSRLPPSSASTSPTMSDAAKASWGVRAKEVRNAPSPHMAAVAPTHINSTPSGSPQSAPKAADRDAPHDEDGGEAGEADGQELAPHDGAGADGRRGQPGQRARGPLHQERAHAETAADEEEDHGDRGGEVVEHRLAAVAERADRHRDGRRLCCRPARQAAGVDPAGQPGRQRLCELLADHRVGPVDDVEAGRRGGARRHHGDEQVRESRARSGDGDASRERPVVHLPAEGGLVRVQPDDDVGRQLAGVHGGAHERGATPRSRRWARRRATSLPAKAKPEDRRDGERCAPGT